MFFLQSAALCLLRRAVNHPCADTGCGAQASKYVPRAYSEGKYNMSSATIWGLRFFVLGYPAAPYPWKTSFAASFAAVYVPLCLWCIRAN